MSAVAARFADGRLHLQHGPIDLIVEAFGAADEVERAYAQAIERFGDILLTLVGELPVLRRPVGEAYPLLRGPVARRMAEAVWPHRAVFIERHADFFMLQTNPQRPGLTSPLKVGDQLV